jgi:uncharacterized repeat protein (TIGR04042 family)
MPEMRFNIRWPDGAQESCYSPSLVVKEYFAPGESYALADFLAGARMALSIASERVRAKYGRPCSLALAQLHRIETGCRDFAHIENARVSVEAFEE